MERTLEMMEKGNTFSPREQLHPAFYRLAEICEKLGFGTIERLEVQNGLPVFLEIEVEAGLRAKVKQKYKLT